MPKAKSTRSNGNSLGVRRTIRKRNLNAWEVTPYNNKNVLSRPNRLEREHVVPRKALKSAGLDLKKYYYNAPTMAVPYSVHRDGVRGGVGGGGITSTGSGQVASKWSGRMATEIRTKGYAAGLKMGITDNLNSIPKVTSDIKSSYAQLVYENEQRDLINSTESARLISMVYDYHG